MKKFTKFLTLDLSAAKTGWTVYDADSDTLLMGAVSFPIGKDENPNLRFRVFNCWLEKMLTEHKPDVVVYEETFMSNKAGTYIHVGFYTRIEEHCAVLGIPTKTISPLSLKKAFCLTGKAEKPQMQDKALQRFPLYEKEMEKDKGGDIADALALLWALQNNPELFETKPKKKPAKKSPRPKVTDPFPKKFDPVEFFSHPVTSQFLNREN